MNSVQEIKDLAQRRLYEAHKLLDVGCPDGAYYLGGYALELALKAIICKNFGIDDLFAETTSPGTPIAVDREAKKTLKVHALQRLIVFSGLKTQIENELGINPTFDFYWSNVVEWNEAARYTQGKSLSDVNIFLNSIDDPTNGILTWLKNYW